MSATTIERRAAMSSTAARTLLSPRIAFGLLTSILVSLLASSSAPTRCMRPTRRVGASQR